MKASTAKGHDAHGANGFKGSAAVGQSEDEVFRAFPGRTFKADAKNDPIGDHDTVIGMGNALNVGDSGSGPHSFSKALSNSVRS